MVETTFSSWLMIVDNISISHACSFNDHTSNPLYLPGVNSIDLSRFNVMLQLVYTIDILRKGVP